MIVLDTNVVSEALRPTPSAKVLAWMRSEPLAALFTTSITEAELLYGVVLLPDGLRRRSLEAAIMQILATQFRGRILPFDSAAAREFAGIAAARRRAGRPLAEADGRIAAIARSRGASLATRNVGDFAGCGLNVIDPWV
ncbi:MAG: type II toxin-antitoxin system VapC family toxin [Stellaceae bacterium]